ncbi:MAG: M23 family metallopeptidase [Spirochaetia bacterium]|nr:M23 family metallopeptidase [Spirochaetia bacterium]
MKSLLILLSVLFCFSSFVNAKTTDIRLIKNLDYSNSEIKALREEIKINLVKISKGDFVKPEFRKYYVKKNDTFFSIMAKTMMDHDTLSSVNALATLWDVEPGATWLIPNMRGIAVFGDPVELSKKYNVAEDEITPVPGKNSLYFIEGKSFDSSERGFLNGTVFLKPVRGIISSKFGLRQDPFSNKHQFHKGIDIVCPTGSDVTAAASGKVIFNGQMSGYGNLIIIEHQNGYRSLYGHLNSSLVQKNQIVTRGQKIALSGATGNVTGPHLHFEVRRKGQALNPRITFLLKDYLPLLGQKNHDAFAKDTIVFALLHSFYRLPFLA